jgi:hypothetical protein
MNPVILSVVQQRQAPLDYTDVNSSLSGRPKLNVAGEVRLINRLSWKFNFEMHPKDRTVWIRFFWQRMGISGGTEQCGLDSFGKGWGSVAEQDSVE